MELKTSLEIFNSYSLKSLPVYYSCNHIGVLSVKKAIELGNIPFQHVIESHHCDRMTRVLKSIQDCKNVIGYSQDDSPITFK